MYKFIDKHFKLIIWSFYFATCVHFVIFLTICLMNLHGDFDFNNVTILGEIFILIWFISIVVSIFTGILLIIYSYVSYKRNH